MMTTWPRTEEANIGLLNEKLRRQAYFQTFWAKFAGFTQVSGQGREKTVIPSGAPIEIMRDFVSQGMDFMLIPMLLNLKGLGIYGDKSLEGNEEGLDLYYNRVYINQIRNGVKTGGRTSEQRMKSLKLEKEKMPLLSEWLANWNEIAIATAFYKGWAQHILAPDASGGLNINAGAQRCHPNFWVAGTGQMAWNAVDATYEAAVDTGLQLLTDTATDHFSTNLIEEARVWAQYLKIEQIITKNGDPFWAWVIHPNQARQLRADSEWQEANQRAWVATAVKENPVFSGAIGTYGGFVFYERRLGVFGAESTGTGTVTFGAANPLVAPDTYAKKCSIIFGKAAMSRGIGEDVHFNREMYDYENVKGVGTGMIVGDARPDYKDNSVDGGTKTAVINQSSAVISTYSADTF